MNPGNLLEPLSKDPEYTFEEAAQVYGQPMTHWKLRQLARRRILKIVVYGPRSKRIRRSELLKLRERFGR